MESGGRLDPAERERMILEHYPLVRIIASRMVRRFPSHIEVDELVNIGILGLIDAIDRFDVARGVPFRSYAEIRIRGAIVDALRDADPDADPDRNRDLAECEAARGEPDQAAREAEHEREKQQERDARSHEHDDYNLPFTD